MLCCGAPIFPSCRKGSVPSQDTNGGWGRGVSARGLSPTAPHKPQLIGVQCLRRGHREPTSEHVTGGIKDVDLIPGAASRLFGYRGRGRAGGGSPVSSLWTFGMGGVGQGGTWVSGLLCTPMLPLLTVPPPKHGAPKAATEDEPPRMEGPVRAPHVGASWPPCSQQTGLGKGWGCRGVQAPNPRGRCPKRVRASAANAPDVPVLAALDGEDWPGRTFPMFGIAHRATSSHWFLTP